MEDYKLDKYKDNQIEQIESEIIDNESSHINYEVLTYPTDFTLEGLVKKIEKEQIIIPEFQRNYVWSLSQASKLIESFLLGLPVPAIFLYTDKDEKLNIIDGQQRLLSIFYFFKGFFGEESKGKKTVFKLIGLKEESPYYNATYESLETENPSAYNKLNDAVLRAFIVKQIQPKDNTSIYHIFERLNTGGTQLQGQEIRNCIYHGEFNKLLNLLNSNSHWRKIFGSKQLNKRKRDEEIILRFFALFYNRQKYSKPMKDFLSDFMATFQDIPINKKDEFCNVFEKTSEFVLEALGEKPFNLIRGFNIAAFDSVFCVIADNIENMNKGTLKKNYERLKKDDDFLKYISSATTDEAAVNSRYERAKKILIG